MNISLYMVTDADISSHLKVSGEWVKVNFPHYAKFQNSTWTLELFIESLRLEVTDNVTVYETEVDACYDPECYTLKVNRGRMDSKAEQEIIAILIHELVEAYGVDSCLYSGFFGGNVIRPEHDYAEFVETQYRQQQGLSACEFALDAKTYARMERMNAFYKNFPIKRRYIGDKVDALLRKDVDSPIDEAFKERVWAMCSEWE